MKASKPVTDKRIAILYQAQPPPPKDGIQKPMKPTGYSDSGADIAYALHQRGYKIISPLEKPDLKTDKDWVFPDTEEGIKLALRLGAEIFWLNTILFDTHPIIRFFDRKLQFVGQTPEMTDLYDDKLLTNDLLRKNRLPIPETVILNSESLLATTSPLPLPAVLKPIRGRGSQGVVVVEDQQGLQQHLEVFLKEKTYGNTLYLEPYLPGQEITLTVMPPGSYIIEGEIKMFKKHWSLPAVKRFNHHNGVAPYNGTVAVMHNSKVLSDVELQDPGILEVRKQCELAAALVEARAPIRVDCRADVNGNYWLFDLNVKPNMTGASRSHRKEQDSLSALAARKIGWSYTDLLENMLLQRWKM